eukprot:UN04110
MIYAMSQHDEICYIEHGYNKIFAFRLLYRACDIFARIVFIIILILIYDWVSIVVLSLEVVFIAYLHVKSGASLDFASSWKLIGCFVTDLHIQTEYTTYYYFIRILEFIGLIISIFMVKDGFDYQYFYIAMFMVGGEVLAILFLRLSFPYMVPPSPLTLDDYIYYKTNVLKIETINVRDKKIQCSE